MARELNYTVQDASGYTVAACQHSEDAELVALRWGWGATISENNRVCAMVEYVDDVQAVHYLVVFRCVVCGQEDFTSKQINPYTSACYPCSSKIAAEQAV